MGFRIWLANRVPRWGVKQVARPYLAGDSLERAVAYADRLWQERRLHTTLDALGEHVDSEARAERALQVYLDAAAQAATRPWISLSIKPGQFGFYVSPALAERQVRRLAERAAHGNVRLTLDMEDTDLTDFTLDLYRRLTPEFPGLGTVLQTRLFRTERDLERLAGLGARVRLCLGVYPFPAEIAYRRKADAKENLLRLLPRAFEILDRVELATHDEAVIARARRLAEERGVPPGKLEFQMLLGVPRARLQDELAAAGRDVRLYVPFAESWDEAVAYLRRRLAESPSLALLVARNLVSRPGS